MLTKEQLIKGQIYFLLYSNNSNTQEWILKFDCFKEGYDKNYLWTQSSIWSKSYFVGGAWGDFRNVVECREATEEEKQHLEDCTAAKAYVEKKLLKAINYQIY